MRKAVITLVFFLIFTGSVQAKDDGFGLSLGHGQSRDSIDVYRVGLVKKWGVRWLESRVGYVDGYYELSYNRWDGGGDEVNAIALSPVFQYAFNLGGAWYPYLEAGIGVAYLDDYRIEGRNLSTNLQFEDRIGLGLRVNNFDLNFRYMHYSNASLKEPNDGIDIWMGTLAWFF